MTNRESMHEVYQLVPFTKKLAEKYQENICKALDQIPQVQPHTLEDLLMEKKGNRVLHKKFEHSFILLDDDKFVGIAIGYERDREENEQYPFNSIYMNDLAVAEEYQKKGIGKLLVKEWLERNSGVGFLALDGELRFSVQTNSAEWNRHVQNLYESFGFTKIAEKQYENRADNVYFLKH
jgi:ribosomal protein S18 acetylase RimI-like enzyme